MQPKDIFIITGTREAGKTLFLSDLFDHLRLFEEKICGFLSKGIWTPSGSKDFVLKDLCSADEIHLASRSKKPGYIPAGRFYFNPEAIKSGKKIIDQAILARSEVILIDEIGPLELMGKVWYQPFMKILEEYPGILVFSSRKRMIDKIIEKFGIYEAFVEDIEQTNPRKTGDAIVSILKKA